jgi:NAD-dependent DNA ligase
MTADILRIANKLALEEKSEFTLEELKQLVIDANAAYRIGNPSITDAEYDKLARYVGIEDGTKEVMDKVDGFEEVQLAVTMASMNKILNGEDFDYWIRTKKINPDSYLIATPKLDGLSLLANECKMPKLYTRGDGVYGRDISRYMKYFSQQIPPSVTKEFYTFGEIIMSRENFAKAKKIFKKKDGSDYENPRNMVSGKLVELEPSEAISYMSYIRYGKEKNDGKG